MAQEQPNEQDCPLPTSGNPFASAGRWFRGNTHTHTVASDGKLTVREVAQWYEDRGYDFLCITDHDAVADVGEAAGLGIVVIGGAEIGLCWDEAIGAEICALGIETLRQKPAPPQAVIDDVLEQGGLPFMSHPHMSGVTSAMMMDLEGLLGIEVFNAHCYGTGRRGLSLIQWDELLTAGRRTLGIACDDRHSSDEDSPYHPPGFDRAKGWIMVRAASRSPDDILDAIRRGMFYSTNGPEIRDIRLTAEEIIVRTSPVRSVRFATIPWRGGRAGAGPDGELTEARLPVSSVGTPARADQLVEGFYSKGLLSKPKTLPSYFRVECWDGDEGWAWSNPIFFERGP